MMNTVVHVTHEAIQKIGGIGAVLHGLLTSPVFLETATRNILIGPFWHTDHTGENRLGEGGEVLYSTFDGIDRTSHSARLREIEHEYGVKIVYGRRRFADPDTGEVSDPEALLIEVTEFSPQKSGAFKFALWKHFGVDSARYEHIWDYEQWVRIAPPAIAALYALGAAGNADPCVIFSHEYMGMPTALAAILEGERGHFRTVFYAHEVATMRPIVEHGPGHDTMFYPSLRVAREQGLHVEDVFGDQSHYYKHALITQAHHCDAIFAVGDYTLEEIRFLKPEFADANAQITYNGVPCWKIDLPEKMRSRELLQQYAESLLGNRPDYLFTHVTRLVPSKGLWRDLRVLDHMEALLRDKGETAVLFTLSTEAPVRRSEDVRRMERDYKWPVAHREGFPDLSPGEAAYYAGVQEFNARSRNIKVVFLNQFGFERQVCGDRMPEQMRFMDIRKGSDVEFGQSIYEPFGIAQVEPISFGGICVFSECCGCAGFVARAAGGEAVSNVIVADYTQLPEANLSLEQLKQIGAAEREAIEDEVAAKVAADLYARLPRTSEDFERLLARGYDLARHMSWDAVARDYVNPGLKKAVCGGT